MRETLVSAFKDVVNECLSFKMVQPSTVSSNIKMTGKPGNMTMQCFFWDLAHACNFSIRRDLMTIQQGVIT